jgi:hypothetical protein
VSAYVLTGFQTRGVNIIKRRPRARVRVHVRVRVLVDAFTSESMCACMLRLYTCMHACMFVGVHARVCGRAYVRGSYLLVRVQGGKEAERRPQQRQPGGLRQDGALCGSFIYLFII